jgi:serine/threonine-protein kinase
MDHPHIAKVFDGGATPSGRPYFVMELVKGVPITDFCDQGRLAPRQRLELFLLVCQAVQHAHQKGIIHRDLKPSNVLVSRHDTTPVVKVIDFGVAKALGQELTDKTLFTGLAQLIGTPLYMSPEQAGMSDLDVDTRSDIYSLGVLLYELLTGTTPFDRERFKQAGYDELRRIIREEEPPKPSTRLSTAGPAALTISSNRGLEPGKLTRLLRGELDWIVMKALEKDRSRRYETANAFALDVQRYLADEPVLACPPSAGYRLRKFARRNKAGLVVAALVLFFLVLLGSGLGWAVRDRAARRSRIAAQVDLILREVDRLEKKQKWPEALAAARRAEAAATSGEADVATAQLVRDRLKALKFIDQLEQIHMRDTMVVEGKIDYADIAREYAQTFHDYGVDVEELAVETSIDRLKTRPPLVIPLAAALDDWVRARRMVSGSDAAGWKRLVAVARGIDPEPLRDRLRSTWGQPVSPKMLGELRRLAVSIDLRAHHPTTLILLAHTLRLAKQTDAALQLLRDARDFHPGDFWLNSELGRTLNKQEDHEGAVRYYTAAVSIRPHLAFAHSNLGAALRGRGKLVEAVAACRKAIDLDSKSASAYYQLGSALYYQKKLREAVAVFQQAIDLKPTNANAEYGLGRALHDQKKLPQAIAAYEKAITASEKAGEFDPSIAGAYYGLGNALYEQNKLAEAVTAYKKAIAIQPTRYPHPYNSLSKALFRLNKLAEAVDACKKAIKIDPNFGDAYNNLGNALFRLNKLAEAIDAYNQSIKIDPKQVDHYVNLGHALRKHKKLPESIAAFNQAIKIDPYCAPAYSGLGSILREQKKLPEAVDAHNRAIKINPQIADFHVELGAALIDQEKVAEAIAAFHKAIKIDPNFARAHYSLGVVLQAKGDLGRAVTAYRRAIAIDPKDAKVYVNLGNILTDQNKLDEAIECFRKAIKLDPKDALAHNSLGAALAAQKKLDQAIECFRKAVAIDQNDAHASGNLVVALRMKGWDLINSPDPNLRHPKRAIEAVNEAVELAPQSSIAWLYLGWVQYRTGNWKSSIEALEKSCKLQKGGTGHAGQWIVLGLAHAKLAAQESLPEKERAHHKAEARRRYEEADKQIDRWWRARPGHDVGQAIWAFRAEARELMAAKDGKK